MSIFKTEVEKGIVLSTDQVVAPNIETKPIDLNLREMQPPNMSVKNTHPGAVRRK